MPGTYYKFAIKAKNVVGDSGLSNETSLIAATVPSKPSAMSLVSQSATAITFSWTADTNTGGTPLTLFKLKWSTAGGTYVELNYSVSPSTLQYTVDTAINSISAG